MEDLLTVSPAPRVKEPSITTRGRRLNYSTIAGEFDTSRLLASMKKESGLTTRQIAQRMGISKESLEQYFHQKRGTRGSSRLSWFLRYAKATGCQVWLSYPSCKTQEELKAST